MLGILDARHIERILHSETVGRIGVCADGRTYVVPITYVYDGNNIYGHSALGLKIRMLKLTDRHRSILAPSDPAVLEEKLHAT